MKLCRFELKAEPGLVRSGMVYGGKVYETAGAEAIAVHEADAIRPLSPIPNAPNLRIFHSDLQPGMIVGMETEEPYFFQTNPTMLAGASQILNFPEAMGEITVLPLLAAVVVSDGYQIPLESGDDVILGYTMMLMITSRTYESIERRVGAIGRSHDLGGVIGPVVTTPDELEETAVEVDQGRRYTLGTILRVNGVERGVGDVQDLPFTAAQAISSASYLSPIRAGDIFALGPLVAPEEEIVLDPGDEVQLAVENLGTLSLKLSRN